MDNETEYLVQLKRGGRVVRKTVVQSREQADQIAQSWYQAQDGNTHAVTSRPIKPVEQVAREIPRDQYLTQREASFDRNGSLR
jgi:hypothetical protein